MKAVVTDFVGLQSLAMDSIGRNRSIDIDWISEHVNPDGCHLCAFKMLHNGQEWRTMWIISARSDSDLAEKVSDNAYGISNVFIDVSFDVFDAVTKTVETDNLIDLSGSAKEYANL